MVGDTDPVVVAWTLTIWVGVDGCVTFPEQVVVGPAMGR